ncbi:Ca2+-dependent phosphoinositide-specific phospholipase C [Mariniflexile ostreae]|uniref:Ca2+-dependent phosphoinositide-specific phospholipase C n=1 Tax=Mariniflexile ostreae TaxID=1520892 RepID=A0ABV5FD48_9FLAO
MKSLKPQAVLFFFFTTLMLLAQNKTTIEVWPLEVPGETEAKLPARKTANTSGNTTRLTDVTNPILTVYAPKKPNASKAGIIVCPGGGYNILAIDKEGEEIAIWLNKLGYTAFVLQYRVPKKQNAAAQDLQRALKIVRNKASLYQLETNKIGLIGFSAGGHLAALASTNYNKSFYDKQDDIDNVSSRPDFTMLIYPAYLDKGAHKTVDPNFQFDQHTPPFFIFGTADDNYGNSGLVMAQALRVNKTPVELHLYNNGGHGYGLRKGNPAAETWPVLAERWLGNILKTTVKLNDIQVIGSHNSYKIPIETPLFDYLHHLNPQNMDALQYGHPSLEAQLDLGLRNIELDVFHDPLGGYFSNPKGLELIKSLGKKPLVYDALHTLQKPGLKMFHVQDIDFRSHHLLFSDGLAAIKSWSDKHPDHSPIFILINAKDQKVTGTRDPLPFSSTALDSIDIEIRKVFPPNKLITPKDVRGDFETLEQAVLAVGWPDLDKVKGRFLFVLDEKETKIKEYLEPSGSLKDPVLFVNSKEGKPEAGFRIINNPIKDFEYIKALVAKGYMVRTRADAGTTEARNITYERFEKAKASGAQVISTDYYIPSTLFESDFKVIFSNNTYERIKNE